MSSEKPKPGGLASNLPPPPAPPAPEGAPGGVLSSQKTVMLDTRAPSVPTAMRHRPADLPPLRRKRGSTWGRWVAGPLLAALVAGGTVALAGVLLPRGPQAPPPKPQGRLRLSSDPVGASILLDGKVYPHFTPTTVEGDVGATLRVTFKLDGYAPKVADVNISEGEHPFAAKLDKLAAPPPEPEPPRPRDKPHPVAVKDPKEPVVKSALSVFVRPWAIVYVDGTRLRQTPVQNFELPVGKHVIELVNETKNRREKISLTLKPGEPEEIRREWDK